MIGPGIVRNEGRDPGFSVTGVWVRLPQGGVKLLADGASGLDSEADWDDKIEEEVLSTLTGRIGDRALLWLVNGTLDRWFPSSSNRWGEGDPSRDLGTSGRRDLVSESLTF